MSKANAGQAIDLTKLTPEQIAQAIGSMSVEDQRKVRDAAKTGIKATKAQTDGEIVALDFTETGTIVFEVRPGDGSRKTKDGKKAYAFSCDGIEFEYKGKTFRTGAFFATEK